MFLKYITIVITAMHLLNVWNNGCRIGLEQTARAFVLLFVLKLEGVGYALVFDAV